MPPVLSSLRRNRLAATLIALQIAVTLAVLCNALFVIEQRSAESRSDSGVRDEGEVFSVDIRWHGSTADIPSRERADLAALRSLPQVVDAVASIDHPLGGSTLVFGITLHPERPGSGTQSMVYTVDEHGIDTLGVRLVAGRNFRATEVNDWSYSTGLPASIGGIIVTQALATRLDPDGQVLGRTVTLSPGGTTAPIIGIVARLQSTPYAENSPLEQISLLWPSLWVDPRGYYIVRARHGEVDAAMKAVRAKLYSIDRQRVILATQTLSDSRRDAYRVDRAVSELMGAISVILLVITSFGILGLTSYWVSQRRRQIGIRRALGATRGAILRYYQLENLLIAAAGSLLGVGLAVAANLWLLRSVALSRLPFLYPLVGVVAMLLIGQIAVLWPATRASAVPPAEATRTV
jgi:putative ABC transport system permease protein